MRALVRPEPTLGVSRGGLQVNQLKSRIMSDITKAYFAMKKEELMQKRNVLIAIGEIEAFVNFMLPTNVYGGALSASGTHQYLYVE